MTPGAMAPQRESRPEPSQYWVFQDHGLATPAYREKTCQSVWEVFSF